MKKRNSCKKTRKIYSKCDRSSISGSSCMTNELGLGTLVLSVKLGVIVCKQK